MLFARWGAFCEVGCFLWGGVLFVGWGCFLWGGVLFVGWGAFCGVGCFLWGGVLFVGWCAFCGVGCFLWGGVLPISAYYGDSSQWVPNRRACRLCEVYIANLGFVETTT